MREIRRLVPSSCALLLALNLAGSPSAHAAEVVCGQTITENTTLTADLGPCPGNGLVIGAGGITLDLGGHRLFGPGTGGVAPGIAVIVRNDVTIQNGTIDGFGGGVLLGGALRNVVQRLVILDNYGSGDGSSQTSAGISLIGTRNSTVINNVVHRNGSRAGIRLESSRGNVVSRNSVVNNNLPLRGASAVDDIGIRLQTGSTTNTITENAVSGSGLDGIALEANANANTVLRNSVSRNGFNGRIDAQRQGDGIRISSNTNTVSQNVAMGNAANGILVAGQSNTIAGNVARGNNAALDAGRPAFDLQDTNASCDANVWSANLAGTRNPACAT